MENKLEHASRTQGKPHARRGQLLSVSTLFLCNLDCKLLQKRAIMSSLHSTGHMGAPQGASAAAQPQRWVAETWWDGQGLQPLGTHHPWWHRGDVTLLVTQGRMCPQDLLPCPSCQAPAAGAPSCLRGQPSPPSTGAPGGTWEPDKENHLSNLLISMTLKQPTGSEVSEEQGQR